MFLDGILNTGYTSPASATSAYKKQNEETSTPLPRSWGSDTVSFSAEAVAARQAEAASNQEEKDDPTAAFSKYMREARGEESSTAGDPAAQLEKLKERLKKLAEQKSQIATEEGTPEATKQSKMEALDAEMNQVISQIAELTTQIAEMQGGGKA